MSRMYVLYEHAAGYALFGIEQFEEIGMIQSQVESSITNLAKFNNVVKLVSFSPFKSAANALDNLNAISEGVLHEDLNTFLETNLPKSDAKVILGVSDGKLGTAISEVFPVQCQYTGIVPELVRGIRHNFATLVKGFTHDSAAKAQLGLGHSYSRAKVKFNVNRVDNMIIQSICLLDQLDKDINTFAMRIREWYSYHFPELIQIAPDNYIYAKLVKFIKNRKDLTPDHVQQLEEIIMDGAKAAEIYEASKSSMGMDISPLDLINIESFASRVVSLSEYRRSLSEYLKTKMEAVAPNLAVLIGEQVGARLISRAGSLTNLAKFPASTLQILGAEKALFRALRRGTNTPKYGLIFHSTFIGRADAKNKGRMSRFLANKCSIASRIDCFAEHPTVVFGEKLKGQVEERLKFYETGEIPRKNIEVMHEAIVEAKEQRKQRKKQRKKKRKLEEASFNETLQESTSLNETQEDGLEGSAKKKKKKKKKNKHEDADHSLNGLE